MIPTTAVIRRMRGALPGAALGGAVTVLAFLAACGGGADDATLIVAMEPILVDDPPTLEIGGGAFGTDDLFVDIVAAAKLDDGSILVADVAEGMVRMFSQEGEPLMRFGGHGEGPGEFQSVSSMRIDRRDTGPVTVRIFDRFQQRVTEFQTGGDSVSTTPLAFPRMIQTLLWTDRGVLFGRTENVLSDGGSGDRSTVEYFAGDSQGGRLVASVEGPLTAEFVTGGSTHVRFALFSPFPSQAAWNRCLYVTSGDEPVVRVFTSDGVELSPIPIDIPPRPLESVHSETWIDQMASEIGEDYRPDFEAIAGQTVLTDDLPFTHALMMDRTGLLWMQPYQPPNGLGPQWLVWMPEAREWAPVTLPEPLRVLEIGVDHLLGVWTDDFGEQILREYPLSRIRDQLQMERREQAFAPATHPECIS